MQILITFIIISIICLILTYYFNLFITQTVYTRSELSNILPQLGNMLKIIYTKYSILHLSVLYLLSGLIAIILLYIFKSWVFNSAIFPVILYFSGPRLAVYFEQTRVIISEDYKDIAEALYVKYYSFILTGFFSGYAVKLIDNWINNGIIDFYWFILNFIILIIISILTLRNEIFE